MKTQRRPTSRDATHAASWAASWAPGEYQVPPFKNVYSVAFDGTDDYASATIAVLGDTHTISAWFKTTAGTGSMGSEATIVSYISTGGGGDDSVLSVASNKLAWSDFVDDDQFGTSTVNDGSWHHGAVVVTATDQKLYVDGVLETTTTNSYSGGTSFSSFALGRRADNTQRYFSGNLDEVALCTSALTSEQINDIYNDGVPADLIGLDGLEHWWRMGDGTLDESGLIGDQVNPTMGSELVTNGDFSSDTWWGKDASWTISGGTANSNGSGTLYKGSVLTIGDTYKVTVDVSAYTSGTLSYPNASYTVPSAVGSYTFYYTAASQTVSFTGSSFVGSIDNVSVKEVNGSPALLKNGAAIEVGAPS